MVKSVLGVNHSGLRDWLVQRISALLMAVYSIWLLLYIVLNPGIDYPIWHALFTHASVKVATIIIILSLLLHAWVGLWTIITDYIKSFILRLILHIIVLLSLVTFFFVGLQILWGV